MPINTLPNSVGVGLKAQHYQEIIDTQPDIGWFEVHPENYMGDGGLPHYFLSEIHKHYPISMHGVGLSLGSAEGLDQQHLNSLATVVQRHQPAQVSEHLAWSHSNSIFLNDLLPVPYTEEFLNIVINNVNKVQDTLQRTILIENPSIYLGIELDSKNNAMTETDFLREVVQRTGCGLLLDINNIYVSANNQKYNCKDYMDNYPIQHVGEIHLAGHAQDIVDNETVLIDDHGSAVIDNVWQLFSETLEKIQKPVPVLIEWDTNIPDFSILLNEAKKAEKIMAELSLTGVNHG